MRLTTTDSLFRPRNTAAAGAFTLPEVLTAIAIFVMVVASVVTVQVIGLKLNALAASKLVSAASSAKVLNQIRNRVLEAYSVVVGNGSSTSFTPTGSTGNALQVYPGANTNNFIRFFQSTNTSALYEWNSANSQLWLLASNVTNATVFGTLDFQGNMSSSSTEHYTILMTLQFAQLDYRIPTNTFDYYTLQTEMTPRGQ